MTLLPAGTDSWIYEDYVSVIRGRGVIPVLLSRATGVEIPVTVCSLLAQSHVALKDAERIQCGANLVLFRLFG
jgi:hypothetical protein